VYLPYNAPIKAHSGIVNLF